MVMDWPWDGRGSPCRVSPFGHPRIGGCSASPRLFAAFCVLLRLLVPRHSPFALVRLTSPAPALRRRAALVQGSGPGLGAFRAAGLPARVRPLPCPLRPVSVKPAASWPEMIRFFRRARRRESVSARALKLSRRSSWRGSFPSLYSVFKLQFLPLLLPLLL